jgi:hypothetical protein
LSDGTKINKFRKRIRPFTGPIFYFFFAFAFAFAFGFALAFAMNNCGPYQY